MTMTRSEAAQWLKDKDHFCILSHTRPDGDTIGCACALCLGLQSLGKNVWVLPNEDAHGLFTPYFEGLLAPSDFVPAHIVAVDTASVGMLPESAAPMQDKIELCIDHHGSNEGYAHATCLDADSAACGEIIYDLLTEMGVSLTPRMAMLLYMAITTDTGCFVYSNTTPRTHRICAALMEVGFDILWINKRHFRTKSHKRMQVESRLVREMALEQNGTIAFVFVTLALTEELRTTEQDLEDIAAFIGQLEGVEHSVTVRELRPGECKISLRTNERILNASDVCARFGGGGHAAAAGCTLHGVTPAQAMERMLSAIEKVQHGE